MGLLLYLNDTNNVTGFIENISSQEAEEIAVTSAEATLYLEDAEFPVYKKGHVIKHNGTDFYYEKVKEPETVNQEPSQLDRIESVVNDIAKNNTSYSEMAQAIAEGVNTIE